MKITSFFNSYKCFSIRWLKWFSFLYHSILNNKAKHCALQLQNWLFLANTSDRVSCWHKRSVRFFSFNCVKTAKQTSPQTTQYNSITWSNQNAYKHTSDRFEGKFLIGNLLTNKIFQQFVKTTRLLARCCKWVVVWLYVVLCSFVYQLYTARLFVSVGLVC